MGFLWAHLSGQHVPSPELVVLQYEGLVLVCVCVCVCVCGCSIRLYSIR
jgi:hypothetical protein